MPPLPASVRQECPPAPPLTDNSLAALIKADTALAFDYARCRERHKAAVEAYDLVRAIMNPAKKAGD